MKRSLLGVCVVFAACLLVGGEAVRDWAGLREYTGANAVRRVFGEWREKAWRLNCEQLALNYGENVDYELRREQVLFMPETAEFLYSAAAVLKPRYRKGTRPALEAVVAPLVAGCADAQSKAAAIARHCRDLKNKAQGQARHLVFGGTEEELLQRGEDLGECLGRLFVALCEVAGIPARIVMHDISGHTAAEAWLGGRWGYFDLQRGIWFLNADGQIASLRDLVANPALAERPAAPEQVDAAWARLCRERLFHPSEIHGFEYYSLADAGKYHYGKVTRAEAVSAGLFKISPIYDAVSRKVFGLPVEIGDYFWERRPLKQLPLIWRNDGFSPWYEIVPPARAETVDRDYIAPFAGGPYKIMVWGTGPGSTFSHRTKAGEIFGYEVKEEQWKTMFRKGDRYVHDNIAGLIRQGIDPQQFIAKLVHARGMQFYSRLEMNHAFAPPVKTNWLWLAFVGEFCKNHPEYLMEPHKVRMDYSFPAVREFQLAILRELAEAGLEGLELDFSIYPPYFTTPKPEVMTGFVRDVRKMLDEVGARQGHRITLQAVVEIVTTERHGLDWKRWMEEKLVDRMLVSFVGHGGNQREFDIRADEMVRVGRRTGCEVYGQTLESLSIFAEDAKPDGIKRYSRRKLPEEHFAQALIFMRSGVDGLEMAQGSNRRYSQYKREFDLMGTPAYVEYCDKNYLVDPFPNPAPFRPDLAAAQTRYTETKMVHLRIADDIAGAREAGRRVKTMLLLNLRPLKEGERMRLYINGHGPLLIDGNDPKENQRTDANVVISSDQDKRIPNWWLRGLHELAFEPEWLWLGENIIRMVYETDTPKGREKIQVQWPEVRVRYHATGKQSQR